MTGMGGVGGRAFPSTGQEGSAGPPPEFRHEITRTRKRLEHSRFTGDGEVKSVGHSFVLMCVQFLTAVCTQDLEVTEVMAPLK